MERLSHESIALLTALSCYRVRPQCSDLQPRAEADFAA